mgnify:CR=1 FL=1
MQAAVDPWREGNQYRLMIDGECFFPRLLEAIEQARESIEIELYLIDSGLSTRQWIDALLAARERGVRVYCLLDGVGTDGFKTAERRELEQAGAVLRFYNPPSVLSGSRLFHRDHRKLFLIDRRIAFVGGTGITDEFCQPDPQTGTATWHEQLLEIKGPVVEDWVSLFEYEWQRVDERARPGLAAVRRGQVPPLPKAKSGQGRVAYIGAREQKEVVASLLAAIKRAEQRVWLATPYFLPSRRIRWALARAARRGVDVRLLLCGMTIDHPPVRYAGQRYYTRLLKAGIRIYEYQPRFTHLKTALVDDWVSLGSCNFDHWTLHWNLEANQQALDSDLAEAVAQSFENDFEQSDLWTLAEWKELPRSHRFKIRFWGQINRWVMWVFGIPR